MRSTVVFSILSAAIFVRAHALPLEAPATTPAIPDVVKRAELNPQVPVFIPVHPRIATTITFPKPIGDPVGTGFVDADTLEKAAAEGKGISARGEYAITYLQGDSSFTVQPLPKSDLLNLNVPYEGATIVLYFYVVDKPLAAVASLTFIEPGTRRASGKSAGPAFAPEPVLEADRIKRTEVLPAPTLIPATPARLDGFLRKLKVVHAARLGPELNDVAAAMNLKVAVSSAEDSGATDLSNPVNDAGLYQLILLRVVRDPALDAVGFVVLFRNTSAQELVFDLRSLSARCGAALYTAQVIDAPAALKPGEVRAGYFAIVGSGDGRPGYLLPNNDWRLSLSLVSPQVKPGQTFLREGKHTP